MTILNFLGFETGDLTEGTSSSGTVSVQSTVVRSGGYAFRSNPTTTGAGRLDLGGLSAAGAIAGFNVATIYETVYFRYATRPASADEPIIRHISQLGALKFELRLNSSGQLAAYDSALTLLATGATVLAADTWYRIEVSVGTGTSAAWEVKINGVSEISGTANLTTSNVSDCRLGKSINRNGNTVDFFYDDVCFDDAAYPGAGQVFRMDADNNGAYTAWTGVYTDVDDIPHDSDTTYLSNATSGNAETVTLESGASAGLVGTPKSVKSCAIVRDEGGSSAIQVRLRSATTDNDTTSSDPGATYVLRALVYNTDPATGAAWLAAALDSLEVGVDNAASVAARCTALSVMVWEDGVAVSARRMAVIG